MNDAPFRQDALHRWKVRRLGQSVSLFEDATRVHTAQLTRYFLAHGVADPAAASHQAIVAIGRTVQRQAYVLAFSDTFYFLGATLVVALLATFLLKKPEGMGAGGAH